MKHVLVFSEAYGLDFADCSCGWFDAASQTAHVQRRARRHLDEVRPVPSQEASVCSVPSLSRSR